jgi:hypothetical protein
MGAISKGRIVILITGLQLFIPITALTSSKAALGYSAPPIKVSASDFAVLATPALTLKLGLAAGNRFLVAYKPPNKGGPRRGTGGSGTR